jgi:hypothetical protein
MSEAQGGESGEPLMDIPIVTTKGGPSPAAVARAARDQARLEAPPPPLNLPKPPPAPELPPEPARPEMPAGQRIVHDQRSRPLGGMVVPLVVFVLVALVGWGIVARTGDDGGGADDAGEQESPDGGGPSPDATPAPATSARHPTAPTPSPATW